MKKCFAIVFTIAAAFAFANNANAGVTASYVTGTGEISVDVDNVVNWYVEQVGGTAMTGPAAGTDTLPLAAGLVTDNDTRIGESAFAPFSYITSLGAVAATGLPDDGTLRVFWNDFLGAPLADAAISFGIDPPDNDPPVADAGGPYDVNCSIDCSVTLDASGSTDDGMLGPLTYKWDLDNNGSFETDAGSSATFNIPDVRAFWPNNGSFNIAVQVDDGEFTDTADTTIDIIPEPGTLALAGIGLIGLVARRRRNG